MSARAPLPVAPVPVLVAALASALVLGACVGPGAPRPLRTLDPVNLDPGCPPCEDIYRHTNGGWLDRSVVPPERGSWSTFSELSSRNEIALRELLDELAEGEHPPGTREQQLADAWCGCLDEERVDAVGLAAAQPYLDRLESVLGPDDVWREVALLHADGFAPLVSLWSDQDAADATRMKLQLSQSGLGLPDRGDYTEESEAAATLRRAYVSHLRRLFVLAGQDVASAAEDAQRVFDLELLLAAASMDRVTRRDPRAVDNPATVAEATAASGLDWRLLLDTVGATHVETVNVRQPEFLAAVGLQVSATSPEVWRAYLRAHVLRTLAPALGEAFEDEDFAYTGRALAGSTEPAARWRRCLDFVESALPQSLGRLYVEDAFSPEAKERAETMVADLRAIFRERLAANPWMGEATRAQALEKLDAFGVKIGYPDVWRDETALRVDRTNHAANLLRARVFALDRRLAQADRPVDRDDWLMAPHQVNAYYNPGLNEIVFPAGILQPPFFGAEQDDAANYGAMGAVIGHEMTHGFDDQGSRYDAAGNLADWWTAEDRAEFERRADVVRAQFDAYEALPGLFVDGSLTLGENIADLGGITIAYHAFRRAVAEGRADGETPLDGLTPDQRVFMAWAQVWRSNYRPEALRLRVTTNTHAPGSDRARGPLSNLPEFAEAFGCEPGDPMVRDEPVVIW